MIDKDYDIFKEYEVGKTFHSDYEDEDDNQDMEQKEKTMTKEIYAPIVGEYIPAFKVDESIIDVVNAEEEKVEESDSDTSFIKYVSQSNHKPRSRISRWLMRIAKLCLFIMLLPLILLIGGIIGGGVAVILGGGIALICLSIAILIGTAFFISTISNTIVALMISLAITLAATGALALLSGFSCCKAGIRGIKQYKMKKSAQAVCKEEK
ncbi:hypothetical protein [Cellulosilyticum sp. I15G10I2]|uniref:hypothetical protein n=1 Tax=Cellulosilyticum sp. I15G10I2 TaxID=1892843 RepID=UPI00085C81C4|nr:hypothetical protein [Cellulosilyticum sp. I15G10I2]